MMTEKSIPYNKTFNSLPEKLHHSHHMPLTCTLICWSLSTQKICHCI